MSKRKLALLGLLLIPVWGFAEPDNDNINRDEAKNRKIVVFQPGTNDETGRAAIENAGGRPGKRLGLINAVAAHFPNEESARNASSNPNVLRVDDDLIVEAAVVKDSVAEEGGPNAHGKGGGTVTPPAQQTPWGIGRVKAPEAWDSTQGAGVNVCVIDTGIDLTHSDLAANIKAGINTINPNKTAKDDNGHGTHVAGTIAALNNAIGVIGAGPQISLLPVKVLGANGSGWLSDIIEGLDWCASNGGKVANMSLGSSSDNQSFHDAVIAAVNRGVTLVVAAGNNGPCANCVNYPARYPETIAVAASDSSDQFASFSSQGPEVDLIAPGKSVLSTYKGNSYATMSGTSMAAPHVSAAAALKLALNPALTPTALADALKANADPLTGLTPDQQGSGIVNCFRLVTSVP
ncbi:MAG: S8 family peptidase [Elusimicrobia bacterium]|nr:S8 family peptidase [Elusimicrobiota bacterium]